MKFSGYVQGWYQRRSANVWEGFEMDTLNRSPRCRSSRSLSILVYTLLVVTNTVAVNLF
jgi:hypothetical protein